MFKASAGDDVGRTRPRPTIEFFHNHVMCYTTRAKLFSTPCLSPTSVLHRSVAYLNWNVGNYFLQMKPNMDDIIWIALPPPEPEIARLYYRHSQLVNTPQNTYNSTANLLLILKQVTWRVLTGKWPLSYVYINVIPIYLCVYCNYI